MAKNTVLGGNPLEPIHGFDGLTSGEIIQSVVLVKEGTDNPLPSNLSRGLRVDLSGPVFVTGRTTIATAGTPAQLNGGTSFTCKAVLVCALRANTDTVTIGDTNVNAAIGPGTERGITLDPGEKVGVDVNDINMIYLDVLGDGHGVTWTVIA